MSNRYPIKIQRLSCLLLSVIVFSTFSYKHTNVFAASIQSIGANNNSGGGQKSSPPAHRSNPTPSYRTQAKAQPPTTRTQPGRNQGGSSSFTSQDIEAIRRAIRGNSRPTVSRPESGRTSPNNTHTSPGSGHASANPVRTNTSSLRQVTLEGLTTDNTRPRPQTAQMLKIQDQPIVVVAFPTQAQQTNTLGRISHYTEGDIGSIVSQSQLQSLYDQGLHRPPAACDFHAQGVTDFYNAFASARGQGRQLQLTSGEIWLHDQLVNTGILKYNAGEYTTGPGDWAVISYANDPKFTAMDGLMTNVIKHEYNHALYYTNAQFKRQVSDVWDNLGASTQQSITNWLANKHYDVRSPDVVIKEFAAYFGDYAASSTFVPSITSLNSGTVTLAAQRLHQHFNAHSGLIRTANNRNNALEEFYKLNPHMHPDYEGFAK